MSDISEKFAKLKSSKLRLRNSTAGERAARMTALWEATVDRKDDLFKAANNAAPMIWIWPQSWSCSNPKSIL